MNVERFKGIEFVRISSLTKEQQQQVWSSFDQEKIIKIIRDKRLLNDCILYTDFVAWKSGPNAKPGRANQASAPGPSFGKLAFE